MIQVPHVMGSTSVTLQYGVAIYGKVSARLAAAIWLLCTGKPVVIGKKPASTVVTECRVRPHIHYEKSYDVFVPYQ